RPLLCQSARVRGSIPSESSREGARSSARVREVVETPHHIISIPFSAERTLGAEGGSSAGGDAAPGGGGAAGMDAHPGAVSAQRHRAAGNGWKALIGRVVGGDCMETLTNNRARLEPLGGYAGRVGADSRDKTSRMSG